MATFGEETKTATATTPSAAYEAGGAGGKFRKKPFRRAQATPYDRPPTSLRNPSWLSKLVVDPASKLINAGARRFFGSLFHKALPPPPALPAISALQLPETQQDSRNVHQASGPNSHDGVLNHEIQKRVDAANNVEGSAFSELEQLLKQKTFSRYEIDRLTELLHSKAADSPHEDSGNGIGVSKSASDASKGLLGDNKPERVVPHGVASSSMISKKIHDDDVASPAELAKTYMGSRQSQVSPSVLSYRSQTVREVVPFVSQSPTSSFTKRPRVTDNGFATPKSLGRSALYNMARTPYSRLRPTDFHKGGSSTHNYLNAGPSSSTLEHEDMYGSKQLSLKRRSSVLDGDDLGSIGPIRRIRQKSNLSYNNYSNNSGSSLHTRGTGAISAVAKNHQLSTRTLEKNKDTATPSTSRFIVPTKSSETAAKILEVINKLSPREKASESKRTAMKDHKFPTQLTKDMLHGQALRSLEPLDSSRLLQTAQIMAATDSQAKPIIPDGDNSTLPKLRSVEENQPEKYVDTLSHVARSNMTFSERDVTVDADLVCPMPIVPSPPQEKRAFKMNAFEDSYEMNDDQVSSGFASNPFLEGNAKQEMAHSNSKSDSPEAQFQHKTASLPEHNTPHGVSSKKIHEENPRNDTAGIGCTDFSTSADVHTAKPKNAFGTATEGSNLTLHGSELEILSSPNNYTSDATSMSSKLPGGDKSLKIGINGKLDSSYVASTSTIATNSLFATPSNNLSNGKVFSSVLAANDSESNAITSVSDQTAPSMSASAATNVATTSSVFGFVGSSVLSATTFSASTSCNTENPDLKAISDKVENGGSGIENLKSSTSFSGMSGATNTNNIFGTDTSAKLSITAQPQGSFFSSGGDSVASAKFLPGSGDSSSAPQTISSQFGSPKPSEGFGNPAGVNTSFSSFTSIAPADSKPFGSGPTAAESNKVVPNSISSSIFAFGNTSNGVTCSTPSFGVSSVSTAPETLSGTIPPSSSNPASTTSSHGSGTVVSTSSTTAPAMFSFSASSVSPSTTAGVFSFGGNSTPSFPSTTTPPTVFGFGGSSAASSSTSSTPGIFSFGSSSAVSSSGTTAPTVFSFGSSSTPSSSSNTTQAVFSFGGNSAASSSNSTPALFGFGGGSGSSSSSSTTTTTSSVFGLGGNSGAFSSGSSASPGGVFSFAATSANNPTSTGTFNFGATSPSAASFGSSPSSISFTTFGASSSTFSTPKTVPSLFGSSPASAASGSLPVFGFGAASSATPSQSVFGNSTPSFTASPNDQMTMEDTMAEDHLQSGSTPAPVSVFGQPPSNSPVPISPFVFGTPNPSPNPFQFGGLQNQGAPTQNPPPFQASGSLEFNGGGGSFSLGSSGPSDKSGRRIVKVNRSKNRKK
ncbi:unnamed protein product [Cuscuta epithymum]|uniref:Nuclear pore complex protein NUP1 n=1 Tax=Cuscuta epithymum TaxID=186058 RepID=A0AAV0GGH6_9ASTE|nr:unnamed protein product [Cuscuta epithymum]